MPAYPLEAVLHDMGGYPGLGPRSLRVALTKMSGLMQEHSGNVQL